MFVYNIFAYVGKNVIKRKLGLKIFFVSEN